MIKKADRTRSCYKSDNYTQQVAQDCLIFSRKDKITASINLTSHLIWLKIVGCIIKAKGGPLAGDANFDIAECLPGGMEQGVAGNKNGEREGF